MVDLQKIKQIYEVNSTYVFGELKAKFLAFMDNYDSLGLSIDGVTIDLGAQGSEEEDEYLVLDSTAEGQKLLEQGVKQEKHCNLLLLTMLIQQIIIINIE